MRKLKVNKGQVMDYYYKCSKCLPADHQGAFCRCEDRNIRIAKAQRISKESWLHRNKTLQPERLNPEDNFDDYLKDLGKYFRRMEDNLLKEIICDSPTPENK